MVLVCKMFGEYGIYCDGRMVVFVCDDWLFVKLMFEGCVYFGVCDEVLLYLSVKLYFVIVGDCWDDCEWLLMLIWIIVV